MKRLTKINEVLDDTTMWTRVKLDGSATCEECGSKINIHIHHMFPKNSFDYYDFTAHDFIYLVPLCGSCHSSQGKALDIAMIAVSKNIKKLKQKFPVEYKLYEKWIQHTTNREMPFIFIKKGDIQRMTEQERLDLADNFSSTQYILCHHKQS